MSLTNFTKRHVSTSRGTQGLRKSEYDVLLDEFEKGGDTLEWTEEDVPRAKAGQIARRLNILCEAKGINKKFHSGFNPNVNMSFVRLRPEGEVPDKEEEEKEEQEAPDRSWMEDDEPSNNHDERVF